MIGAGRTAFHKIYSPCPDSSPPSAAAKITQCGERALAAVSGTNLDPSRGSGPWRATTLTMRPARGVHRRPRRIAATARGSRGKQLPEIVVDKSGAAASPLVRSADLRKAKPPATWIEAQSGREPA